MPRDHGGVTADEERDGAVAAADSQRGYGLVNNWAERNVPLVVDGLLKMLRPEVLLSHRLTAENIDIVISRMAEVLSIPTLGLGAYIQMNQAVVSPLTLTSAA